MAINTSDERRQAFNFLWAMPNTVIPDPDGMVDANDRAMLFGSFGGAEMPPMGTGGDSTGNMGIMMGNLGLPG